MPRFNIGDYAKEKKRLREKIVMKNRDLKVLDGELNVMAEQTVNKTKELDRIKTRHQRLDEQVGLLLHFTIYLQLLFIFNTKRKKIYNSTQAVDTYSVLICFYKILLGATDC